MRQQQGLCKLRQTTREDTFAYSSRLGVCEWEMTYGRGRGGYGGMGERGDGGDRGVIQSRLR